MEGLLHRIAGTVAEEAAAAAGLAPATQDHDLAAVPTPGPDLALVLTARAHEADPAPGQRVLTEQNAPASHVPSPKIKIERANGFGGELSAVWCFIQRYIAF